MSRNPVFNASDPLLDARPAATLDLHGHTAPEAVASVRNFVTTWQRRARGGVVHVITGKGKGSTNGAVLRNKVKTLLKSELHILVADFALDTAEGGFLVKLR